MSSGLAFVEATFYKQLPENRDLLFPSGFGNKLSLKFTAHANEKLEIATTKKINKR